MLKHGVIAEKWQFYLKNNGSGGGTRTPDTRIMIKLLQLFIFYLSCLQAHKLGVLKSV
jgi:hypothetical protein